MAAITLYDLDVSGGRRPSPFCWRAKFALAHKGLAWDEVPVGFTEKDKIAFAQSRTVPVMVDHDHGGRVVKDSWDIAERSISEALGRQRLAPVSLDERDHACGGGATTCQLDREEADHEAG